jgi:hypothetical protein
MKSSETVIERGLYSSDCCDKEQIFDVDDTFTRCPRCMGLCVWDLCEQLATCEELEVTEAIAA